MKQVKQNFGFANIGGGALLWGAFIYLILVTMPLGINACLEVIEYIL